MFIYCPSCKVPIEIEAVNCGIFRCGVYKVTGAQLDPHATQAVCENAVKANMIWGCGKPFSLETGTPEVCEYK